MQRYPKSVKTTLQRIFFIQSCLEALRQQCIEFLTVQCCPKTIKTTLNRVFSDAVFSGAFWTRLHRVLTREILSQEY